MRRFDIYKGEDEHLGNNTLNHNIKKIWKSILKHDRVYAMIRPVLAIDDIITRIPNIKIL